MKLLLLGSCRIHYPLGSVDEANNIEILNKVDPMWFMHNVRAAEQSLRIIKGELAPPLHLKELIFETDDSRHIDYVAPDAVSSADAIVIEMCTLKSLRLEGWELNPHRVFREEKKSGKKIEGIEQTFFTPSDIAHYISLIKEQTSKPVLIVNHIRPTNIVPMDVARQKLTDFILTARKTVDFEFFDTTSVLDSVSTETALEDHSHYREEFEPVIGDALVKYIEQCFS